MAAAPSFRLDFERSKLTGRGALSICVRPDEGRRAPNCWEGCAPTLSPRLRGEGESQDDDHGGVNRRRATTTCAAYAITNNPEVTQCAMAIAWRKVSCVEICSR